MPNVNYLQQWINLKPNKTKITNLSNTTFTPQDNHTYIYTLSGNEVFNFSTSQTVCTFRLYLITQENNVSFTLPTNIIWEKMPDFNYTDSLYMLVFQWSPTLNKWLGNQMWNPVTIGE